MKNVEIRWVKAFFRLKSMIFGRKTVKSFYFWNSIWLIRD